MSKIALHLAHLTPAEKIALGRANAAGLAADPHTYAAPDVPVAALTQATDALEQTGAAAATAHHAWLATAAAQRAAEKTWDGLATGEARYVERATGGDEQKMKALGYRLAAAPVHGKAALPAPTRLSVTDGDQAGMLDAHWDRVHGAPSYEVATADASEGPWTLALGSTSSKARLEGLASGKKLWLRVAALGSQGTGAWSAPVQATVP